MSQCKRSFFLYFICLALAAMPAQGVFADDAAVDAEGTVEEIRNDDPDLVEDLVDDLVDVKSRLYKTKVKPGIDLSQFNAIFIEDAVFQYRDVKDPGNTAQTRSRSGRLAYPINDTNRARFEELVGEVFDTELKNSKHFVETDKPGEGVLLVRGGLADIVSFVPPNRAGNTAVYLSEVGQATLFLEIRDSETLEVLVRAVDRRQVRPNKTMLNMNSAPVNKAETKRVIKRWAQILVRGLDDLHEAGPLTKDELAEE